MAAVWKFSLGFSLMVITSESQEIGMQNLVWGWVINIPHIMSAVLFVRQQLQHGNGVRVWGYMWQIWQCVFRWWKFFAKQQQQTL